MSGHNEDSEFPNSDPDDMVSSSCSAGLLIGGGRNFADSPCPSAGSASSPSEPDADGDVTPRTDTTSRPSRNLDPNPPGPGIVSISIQDFESLRSQVDEQASELSLLQAQVQLQNDRIEAQNNHIAQLLQEIKKLKNSCSTNSATVPSASPGHHSSPSLTPTPKSLWTNRQDPTSEPSESKSISELAKETAQQVLQLQEQKSSGDGDGGAGSTDFIYDSVSGLYFDQKSGYYYDPHRQLYYNGHTRTYYSFDSKTGQYSIHSQLPPTTKKGKDRKSKRPRKQPRPDPSKSKEKEQLESQDLEDGELTSSSGNSDSSSSSEDDEDKCSSGTVDLEDEDEVEEVKVVSAPCIRGIVLESLVPSLWKGYLFLVTISGGSIGREGDHHVIQIPDLNVSKNHARISYELDDDVLPLSSDNRKVTLQRKYFIRDLGSQNGTWLNRSRLSDAKVPSERFEIAHGSHLRIGDTTLLLHIHEGNSTCGHCEPGLIAQDSKSKEPLYPLNVPSKEKQMKKEFRKISKKYGVSKSETSSQKLFVGMVRAETYKDRAQERRQNIGSDNPYEKTQVASLDTAIQPENKGFQMLQKMGWKNDGMGLGQGSSGISEPVKIHMNIGRSGLGLSGGIESSSSPPPSHYKKPIGKPNKSNSNIRKIQFATNTKIRKTDPSPDPVPDPPTPACIQLD